jgi:spectinomycin phosphotransferase
VKVPPPGLDEQRLVLQLAAGWGVVPESLRYLPEGFGSYHWVAETSSGTWLFLTVDDLDGKPWLGADRDTVFAGLRACYGAAAALRDRARLSFVLAPHADGKGAVIRRLTDQYTLAVFPYVDGESGRWGDSLSEPARTELLVLLAGLHGATPVVGEGLSRRGWGLPGRGELEAALADLDRPWATGPYGETARALVCTHIGDIRRWLAEYDGLADVLAACPTDLVVTHGEPHPGNLLKARRHLYFIDWDTVALAPPERDLWMLGRRGGLDGYVEVTGRTPDSQAIEFYRLMWRLQDLAAFIGVMRAPHADDADTEKAWRAIGDYLGDHRQPEPWT